MSAVYRLRRLRRRPARAPFPPDFPLYTFVDWPGGRSASTCGSRHTAGEAPVVTDTVVGHWDAEGNSVEVECAKREDGWPDRSDERRRAVLNTVFEYVHRRSDLDSSTWGLEADRVLAESEDGTRLWSATTFDVDGVPIEFDVFDFGYDVWAATGDIADVHVTMSACGVRRAGLKLGTVTGYILARPPLEGWRAKVPRWRPKTWWGRAVRNRLYEWRSWLWHNLLGQPPTRPKGTIYVPSTSSGADPAQE